MLKTCAEKAHNCFRRDLGCYKYYLFCAAAAVLFKGFLVADSEKQSETKHPAFCRVFCYFTRIFSPSS